MPRSDVNTVALARGVLLIAVLVSAPCSTAIGQTPEAAETPRIDYHVSQISASAGGLYAYLPERWGLIRVRLANPHETPAEVLCATYFGDHSELQYGRRVWIPARSQLFVSHPALLPPASEFEGSSVPFNTLVVPAGEDHETLIRDRSGKAQFSSTLRTAGRVPLTGIMSGPAAEEPETDPDATPFDVVVSARLAQGLPRQVTRVDDQFLPTTPEGFDCLDSLVIARRFDHADAAGIAAIRSWLYNGGRLWVMLNDVDPLFLETLLGDESACEVVDRVGLNRVELTSGPQGPPMASLETEYERPVDLVRVVVDDADVLFLANGWPAAFARHYGAGRLLVTTLDVHAWVRPRAPGDPANAPSGEQPSMVIPHPHLIEFSPWLFSPRPAPVVPGASFAASVPEYVGYRVPARSLVIGVLSGFTALLILAGTWLTRVGRLEWLGAIVPALAVIAGGTLVLVGRARQDAVPETVALVQLVQPVPGTDSVTISGLAGRFSSRSGMAEISGTQGGRVFPDMSGMEGTTRRLMWTDTDQWRWERLPQSPGLRQAEFAWSGAPPARCNAVATFDAAGLQGRIALPPGLTLADGLLATKAGRIALDFAEDGSFHASTERTLADDQFLGVDLMSDEQHRRARIFGELLAAPYASGFPLEPTVLFWTQPWETGFQFGDGVTSAGSALVALPLKIRRPPGGTIVTIPAPLADYREAMGPDGTQPVGLYNNRTGRWEEKSSPSATWIAIRPPPALLPLLLTHARFTVRVAGPVGRLELAGWREGQVVALQTWTDPVGTLSATVEDAGVLQLTPDGVLFIRVAGGDPDRPELTQLGGESSGQFTYWRLESLDVELRAAVVSPRPAD
jgi:hypothetical protein